MRMRGDIRQMGALADRLDDLASVPSRASKAAAASLTELLAEQFEEGKDPYGDPWAALADRTLEKHDEPSLQAEFGGVPGPMASATVARARGGAGIALSSPYADRRTGTILAPIHQTGAAVPERNWEMPARPIFPEGEELPEAWQDAIDDAVEAAFAKGGRR